MRGNLILNTRTYFVIQVGSGYTMNELRELGRQLQPYWKVYNPKKPPECLLLAAGHKVELNQVYVVI